MVWNSLLTSDVGLFSLIAILFIVGMAVWFVRFFSKKMSEEEAQLKSAKSMK